MSSDDLTRDITDSDTSKTTQPTMAAVFRLLTEVKSEVQNINVRIDATNVRLDAIEARLGALETRLDALVTRLDALETRLDAVEARLGALETRLDAVEARLVRDFDGLNNRVIEGFRELSHKIDALNRSRLQTEADYFGLLQRVTDIESKAS